MCGKSMCEHPTLEARQDDTEHHWYYNDEDDILAACAHRGYTGGHATSSLLQAHAPRKFGFMTEAVPAPSQLPVECSAKPVRTLPKMPALAVAGVRWHIASDDVPLLATFGSGFHAIWIMVILLTSQGVLNMPHQCHHEGRQYIATVTGLLFCFTFGFVVELLLIWEGCKGMHMQTQAVKGQCLA